MFTEQSGDCQQTADDRVEPSELRTLGRQRPVELRMEKLSFCEQNQSGFLPTKKKDEQNGPTKTLVESKS